MIIFQVFEKKLFLTYEFSFNKNTKIYKYLDIEIIRNKIEIISNGICFDTYFSVHTCKFVRRIN